MRYPPIRRRHALGVLMTMMVWGCEGDPSAAGEAGAGGLGAGGLGAGGAVAGGSGAGGVMAGGAGGSSNTGGAGGAAGGAGGMTGGAGGEIVEGCAAPGQPLRRLTRIQYLHTINDLLEILVGETGEGEHFWWVLQDWTHHVPEDVPVGAPNEVRGGFRRLDQVVYDEHIEAALRLATVLGGELAQPWWARAVAQDCDLNDEALDCLTPMVDRVGRLVHRRPLSEAERAFYLDLYHQGVAEAGPAPNPDDAWWWPKRVGLTGMFTAMLSAPRLIYQVEHGAEIIDAERGLYALDAYELASRLSYHFWQSTPDEALLNAAASGELLTEAGFEAEVARIYADPRTRRALSTFFTEWLRLDEMPDPARLRGTPIFEAFADGLEIGPELGQAMVDEIVSLATHYAVDAPGSFDDLLTSDLNFAADDTLATIYQTEPWRGGAPAALPEPERAGLITRAALLVSGSANTRPILKGVRIREAILCGVVPPPPPEAMAQEPALSEQMTSREVVESLTEQPGTVCAGCHTTYINPLGFATEGFDALGRRRDAQGLYDEWGNLVGSRPIETASTPQVITGDDAVAEGAADLTALILESGEAHRCFARQYFRFTFGRPEHPASDSALINGLTERLQAGAALDEVLVAVALDPEFKILRACVDGEE